MAVTPKQRANNRQRMIAVAFFIRSSSLLVAIALKYQKSVIKNETND
jgi:hypothetical protein